MGSLDSVKSTKYIDLESITADSAVHFRENIDHSKVEVLTQLLLSGIELDPIVLYCDGEVHWLSDGFIRLAAYKNAGLQSIKAKIRQGLRRDAILFSIEANAKHGLGLSNAEKKQAAKTLLQDPEWSQWSGRKIGKICGLDNKTVEKIRSTAHSLSFVSEEFPQIQNLMNSDGLNSTTRKAKRNGKNYDINTSKIGIGVSHKSEAAALSKDSTHSAPASTPKTSTGIVPSNFVLPELIDDSTELSVLPELTASELRLDPTVLEASGESTPLFSLLNVGHYQKPLIQNGFIEYNLKLVISGPPNAIPLILEQMRLVPEFADLIFREAQKLAKSNLG